MKKGLVIFAATSMMAAGVSLAANVSIGQKMAAMLANAFEFVGPVSGLVHALVKPKDESKAPVVPAFENDQNTVKGGALPPVQKGSRAPVTTQVAVAAPAEAASTQGTLARPLDESSRMPNVAVSALNTQSMVQDGSVAKAIVESGNGATLASLGQSLQTKSAGFSASLQHEVWANVMSKPSFAPIQLAMNTERQNKQIEAGSSIARNITDQGQTAAAILSQSAAANPASATTGATGSTASLITASALARANTPTQSGQVPVPASALLILAGLVAISLGANRKHQGGTTPL